MQKIIGNSILDSYFGNGIMSLHLKEGARIAKKGGGPGDWKVIKEDEIMTKENLYGLIDSLFVEVEKREDGFLEIDKEHFKIVQLGPYRIVIVYPPLANGLEMTVVKPVKILSIGDYELDDRLSDFLHNEAQGVLVSGAPGSGKTTFAQALLESHCKEGKIIKTIESPRDLLVDDEVVQYSFSYGSHSDLRDILLLSRPDYTVFDEVRNVEDFELFKDLRLTGIGLLGVIHATNPVDSIQRFLGHIDLGVIPQMIDTILFIEKGKIARVLQLSLTVKVPEGMDSGDLARPVIMITDFEDQKVYYEIYSFGQQIVVIPLDGVDKNATTGNTKKAIHSFAEEGLKAQFDKIFDFDFLLSVKNNSTINFYIPKRQRANVIGQGGGAIQKLESDLGMRISVKGFSDLPLMETSVRTDKSRNDARIVLSFEQMADQKIYLLVDNEILPYRVDKRGRIVITGKGIVKKIHKHGFVVVDTAKL